MFWYIYRPQTKFAKVMFLQVSVCPHGGGACVVLFGGGHAWFYLAWGVCVRGFIRGGMRGFIQGGMRGFIRGACMVLFGGHAWFYSGGHAWFYSGGVRGFIRAEGACMVLFGGHAWFYLGGMRGFIWGGMCGFFSFFGYNEIRSMGGRYASYWNAFLYELFWYYLQNMSIYTFVVCDENKIQIMSTWISSSSFCVMCL